MNKYALALLVLAVRSTIVDAAGPTDLQRKRPLSDTEKYSRPISEKNPFGIDYGFNPILYATRAQGVPTYQLSMYHAQIIFAEDKCTTTDKPTRQQRGFRTIMLWDHDKELGQAYKLAYAQAVEKFGPNYQHAWEGMDESQRSQYCADYWNDIGFRGEFKAPLINALFGPNYLSLSQFYLGALSPISSESIEELERKAKAKEEQDKFLGAILLIGQVISVAGGLSAGNDAITAGKSGNYSIAQMRYAQSRNLLRISGGIGATTQASLNMDSQTAPSQQPPQPSCRALDHFDQYDAEPDSDVWKKYQSLSSGCDALNNLRVR